VLVFNYNLIERKVFEIEKGELFFVALMPIAGF
jgi:hypothetical protein